MYCSPKICGVAFVLTGILAESVFGFSCATERRESDAPDDSTKPQVHVVYVVPADGQDRRLDVDGRICHSIQAMNRWLSKQTSGHSLRFDTFRNSLDVTFVRLDVADRAMRGLGQRLVSGIEWSLQARGYLVPGKIYAVFYDGTSETVCGGAAYPPSVPGQVAAIYLNFSNRGTRQPCDSGEPPNEDSPGYTEFAVLHDVLHALGFVPNCAPHFGTDGHVDDNPLDLMYSGDRVWNPTVLDPGQDDYYGHGRSGCRDLARSPYLTPAEARPSSETLVTGNLIEGKVAGENEGR